MSLVSSSKATLPCDRDARRFGACIVAISMSYDAYVRVRKPGATGLSGYGSVPEPQDVVAHVPRPNISCDPARPYYVV